MIETEEFLMLSMEMKEKPYDTVPFCFRLKHDGDGLINDAFL
jgi:hypothetical protein